MPIQHRRYADNNERRRAVLEQEKRLQALISQTRQPRPSGGFGSLPPARRNLLNQINLRRRIAREQTPQLYGNDQLNFPPPPPADVMYNNDQLNHPTPPLPVAGDLYNNGQLNHPTPPLPPADSMYQNEQANFPLEEARPEASDIPPSRYAVTPPSVEGASDERFLRGLDNGRGVYQQRTFPFRQGGPTYLGRQPLDLRMPEAPIGRPTGYDTAPDGRILPDSGYEEPLTFPQVVAREGQEPQTGIEPIDPYYKNPRAPHQAPTPEELTPDVMTEVPHIGGRPVSAQSPEEYDLNRREANQRLTSTARQRLTDRNVRNIDRLGIGGGALPMDKETQAIYDRAINSARRGRRARGAEISGLENSNRFGGYPTGPVEPEAPAGPVTTRGLPGLKDRFRHLGGQLGDVESTQESMNPLTAGKYNPDNFVEYNDKGEENVINTLPGGSVPFRTKRGGIGLRGAEVKMDAQGNPVEGWYGRYGKGPQKDRYAAQVARHLAKKMGIRGRQAIEAGETPEQAITRLSGMMQNGEMTRPMAERLERRRRYFGVGGNAPIGGGSNIIGAGDSKEYAKYAPPEPVAGQTPEDYEATKSQKIDQIFRDNFDNEEALVKAFKKGKWSSADIMPKYEQAKHNMRGMLPGDKGYDEKLKKLNKWKRIIEELTGEKLPDSFVPEQPMLPKPGRKHVGNPRTAKGPQGPVRTPSMTEPSGMGP